MHLPKRLKFLCPAHCKPPASLEDSPPYRRSSASAAWIRAHHFWTFSASGRQKIPSRKIRVSIPNITSGLPWDNFFSLMAVLPNKQRTSLAMISSDTLNMYAQSLTQKDTLRKQVLPPLSWISARQRRNRRHSAALVNAECAEQCNRSDCLSNAHEHKEKWDKWRGKM